MVRNRTSTGIENLDNLMDGGIPEGNSVLLVGPAGSGKTTFGLLFAVEQAKHDKTAVCLFVGQEKTGVIESMDGFGNFYEEIKKLQNEGKLLLFNWEDLCKKYSIEGKNSDGEIAINKRGLLAAIEKIVIDFKASILVIDSITAIMDLCDDRDKRNLF